MVQIHERLHDKVVVVGVALMFIYLQMVLMLFLMVHEHGGLLVHILVLGRDGPHQAVGSFVQVVVEVGPWRVHARWAAVSSKWADAGRFDAVLFVQLVQSFHVVCFC